MATSAVNPLEEHISCSVCLEVYTNPHILRCLHTFCYQCIQGVKQGKRVQCPECRWYTNFREVKKDFKMESLIAINRNTSQKNDKPQETVCDLCEDPTKPVQSFCTKCEDRLCANCSKAHRKSKATKDHKLETSDDLVKSKKQEMYKYIQTLTDEEREMDSKCTSNRELINNIKQAEVRQIVEVNRLRQSIIDDVNRHHDSLLSEIQSINQNTIKSLEQQGQLLTEARQQLADKKQVLADVSQAMDIALLTDMLKHLNSNFKEELSAIHSRLSRVDKSVESSVQVVKGNKWNSGTSTRIEMTGTVAIGGSKERHRTPSPRRGPSYEGATAAAIFSPSIGLSFDMMKRKEIHPRYRKVKSVEIEFDPHKLCVFRDELWVGDRYKGVFVFNTDLQQIKHITNKHLKYVISVLRTDTDVIMCDKKTGLHVLNQRGDYLKHVCSGQFSDASVTNNILLGLEYAKQQIHVFSKSQNGWVKDRELNLSGYSNGCNADTLCTTSTCIYISCCNTRCVRVYSLTGQFLYETGKYDLGKGLKASRFFHPVLSDVDSGGKLLLCDFNNYRLQVFHPHTRQWAEIQGLEGLGLPLCAGVGHTHLWVGTFGKKLLKFEAQ